MEEDPVEEDSMEEDSSQGQWSMCEALHKEMDEATKELLSTMKVNKIMVNLDQRFNIAFERMPNVEPLPKWCCHGASAGHARIVAPMR